MPVDLHHLLVEVHQLELRADDEQGEEGGNCAERQALQWRRRVDPAPEEIGVSERPTHADQAMGGQPERAPGKRIVGAEGQRPELLDDVEQRQSGKVESAENRGPGERSGDAGDGRLAIADDADHASGTLPACNVRDHRRAVTAAPFVHSTPERRARFRRRTCDPGPRRGNGLALRPGGPPVLLLVENQRQEILRPWRRHVPHLLELLPCPAVTTAKSSRNRLPIASSLSAAGYVRDPYSTCPRQFIAILLSLHAIDAWASGQNAPGVHSTQTNTIADYQHKSEC